MFGGGSDRGGGRRRTTRLGLGWLDQRFGGSQWQAGRQWLAGEIGRLQGQALEAASLGSLVSDAPINM